VNQGGACHLWEQTGWDDRWLMVRNYFFVQNQQTKWTRWLLPFEIRFPVIAFGGWETGNWKVYQTVRKFPPSRSKREDRTTSEGSLQFPNGSLFHLTRIVRRMPLSFATCTYSLRLLTRGIITCMSRTSRLWLVNRLSVENTWVSSHISVAFNQTAVRKVNPKVQYS